MNGTFVDNAMGYGDLAKKFDVFYEKLLVKRANYAIMSFDRRKPSNLCPRVRQKTVPSNHRSFPAGTAYFTQKGENATRMETLVLTPGAGPGQREGGFCSLLHSDGPNTQ